MGYLCLKYYERMDFTMSDIKIMPPEDVDRMFARLGELTLDVSGIHRKFIDCYYGPDSKQALDIYLPNDGDGPFPVVFYAHGGGFARGDKSDVQVVPFIDGVNRGYAIVNLNYRLIPHIRYPENVIDIKAAMRWVARNASTYMLNPDRTALCGASAGAYLAMMAAFTQGQAAFDDAPFEPTCRVLAVVEQFGPVDFLKIHAHYDESGYPRAQAPGAESAMDVMLGVKAELIPNLARYYNPIDNVHPGIPPVLIQHGRHDPIIPYQQAVELHWKICRIAGDGKAELDISEDFLHADPGYAGAESVERIFSFLDKYLK